VKHIVVEITLTTDAEGGTTTFYFSTKGFTTKSGDTPPNEHIAGRVKDAGRLKRELFSGGRVIGAIKPSFGEIILTNTDGGLDGWIDYGASGGRVVVRIGEEGNPYPGDDDMETGHETVYIAYIQSLICDFKQVRVRLRDRMQKLDKPVVTATFDGSGGLEGTGVASGVKQLQIGVAGYFPPQLIDEVRFMYYVQESAVTDSDEIKVYEGGVLLTRDGDYSSSAEMLSTSPDPGRVRFWFGSTEPSPNTGPRARGGPVYFRLGSSPEYEIRCICYGSTGTSNIYPDSIFAMLQRAGFDDTEIAHTTGLLLYITGSLIDDATTYAELLSDEAIYQQHFFGVTRTDRFFCGALREPSEAENYFSQHYINGNALADYIVTRDTFTFTTANAKSINRIPVDGMEAPVWQVNYSFGKTWPCESAVAATAELRNYLSRDPWWKTYSGKSDATLLANPGALSVSYTSNARSVSGTAFSQSLFLTNFFTLFGGRRDVITLTAQMTSETLAIELSDNCVVRVPRFGCDAGRIFRVIAIELDTKARQIHFWLWGGTAGTGGGIDTGGETSTDSDPYVIQAETAAFLTTETGLAILIETPLSLLLSEADVPLLTQTSAPVLTEL